MPRRRTKNSHRTQTYGEVAGGNGVEEAGRKTSESTVAESRISLLIIEVLGGGGYESEGR